MKHLPTEMNLALVWFCWGKEAYSTEGQYFILKLQFQPCFYSLPRTPSGSHLRGSWFKPDSKKASFDRTHRGMTRRGRGPGGDPPCPPRQKQWVTLGPKYRLCGCHLGKTSSRCWPGWAGLLGRAPEAAPVCQPLLCQPCFSGQFWPYSSSPHLLSLCLWLAALCPHLFPSLWHLPPLPFVSCRPHPALARNSRCCSHSVCFL